MSKKKYKFNYNSMPPHLEKRFLNFLRKLAPKHNLVHNTLIGYEAAKKGNIPDNIYFLWSTFIKEELLKGV